MSGILFTSKGDPFTKIRKILIDIQMILKSFSDIHFFWSIL